MAQKKDTAFLLNHVMYINKAAIGGQCEDAYAFNVQNDYGIISVFDGCGGLGAKKYANCGNRTAAYIAARIAASTVLNWFETKMTNDQSGLYASTQQIASSLKDSLDKNFLRAKQSLDVEETKLSGSLIRSFPTTASIVLIDSKKGNELKCTFLWAGDSRGFILQPDGLKQCTTDDLRIEEDAFENLYADSPLSNMVNGDGKYRINRQRITCSTPAIVFTATDGTFGYLPSPMHCEWMIVRTLCDARSFIDWQTKLRDEISSVTGDDSTLVMAVYGWESFSDLQISFKERECALKGQLDQEPEVEELRELWQSYKQGYALCAENASAEK